MIKSHSAALVSGLSAVGIVALAWLWRSGQCACGERAAPESEPRVTDAALVLEDSPVARADRIAVASTSAHALEHASGADDDAASGRGAARQGTEAWYRARFLDAAAHEPRSLEASAHEVLAGDGPDCEKVALLRALCDTHSTQASAILLTAVVDLPDVSSPAGASVPRCALRFLAERAPKDAHARAALMQLAWSNAQTLSSSLRASAASTIALVAAGAEALQLTRNLELERDPLVRAAALEALSRNPDPDAAAAFRSLGVVVTPQTIGDGEG